MLGDIGLRAMLEPSWLANLKTESTGTRLMRVRSDASSGLLPEENPLELVSLGVDYYEVELDVNLDIVVSWSSYLQGELVTYHRIGSVTKLR